MIRLIVTCRSGFIRGYLVVNMVVVTITVLAQERNIYGFGIAALTGMFTIIVNDFDLRHASARRLSIMLIIVCALMVFFMFKWMEFKGYRLRVEEVVPAAPVE